MRSTGQRRLWTCRRLCQLPIAIRGSLEHSIPLLQLGLDQSWTAADQSELGARSNPQPAYLPSLSRSDATADSSANAPAETRPATYSACSSNQRSRSSSAFEGK